MDDTNDVLGLVLEKGRDVMVDCGIGEHLETAGANADATEALDVVLTTAQSATDDIRLNSFVKRISSNDSAAGG